MSTLAIIPARSGSKGLPNKNILLLNGKPLIVYSIEAALASKVCDEVMVSTDSAEYAKIAKQAGAQVPFLRSPNMSSDTATTWDAVREVLDEYEKIGKTFDAIILLQPTSPLRDADHVREAYQLHETHPGSTIVSVCEVDHSPSIMNTLPADGAMDNFIDKTVSTNRQENPTYYRINGAIYIVPTHKIRNRTDIFENSFAYKMEKATSIDIDDRLDFDYAALRIATTTPKLDQ